jgi:hypothetical protein
LVKSLKDFNINAFGVDLSKYATDNCPKDIIERIFLINSSFVADNIKNKFKINKFNYGISKDVFEHISEENLCLTLVQLSYLVDKLFVVVPLGDNGKYRIPAYHLDPTHVIAEDENWWKCIFLKNGFKILDFNHSVDGIKDRWNSVSQIGNGFFLLQSESK